MNTFDVAKNSEGYPRCFGKRFLGYVRVPRDGAYTIFVRADDASRLWFGDCVVVDNVEAPGWPEQSGTIVLKKGLHPIRVDYYQREGGYWMKVGIKGPGMERKPLPDDMLWHEGRKGGGE